MALARGDQNSPVPHLGLFALLYLRIAPPQHQVFLLEVRAAPQRHRRCTAGVAHLVHARIRPRSRAKLIDIDV
jgi:hypothetical protein